MVAFSHTKLCCNIHQTSWISEWIKCHLNEAKWSWLLSERYSAASCLCKFLIVHPPPSPPALRVSQACLNINGNRDSTVQKFIQTRAAPLPLSWGWWTAFHTFSSHVIPPFEQQRETESSTRCQRSFGSGLSFQCQFPLTLAFPVSVHTQCVCVFLAGCLAKNVTF